MKKLVIMSTLLIMNMESYAQAVEPGYLADAIITPHFFVTVIAGVILALGFQFILTSLSVAAGISAIGDVKKTYIQSKNNSSDKDHFYEEEPDNDNASTGSTGVMVTTGFGIWSTLTVAISLFAATALAINLSLVADVMANVTLALVIWATFFILLFYLESKVVNTLIGGLINTATAGLRTSADAVKGIFATSKEKKIQNIAENTIDKIRKDFDNPIDGNVLNDTINEFFEKMDQKVPSYDKVKQDIEQIVNESVEKSNSKKSGGSSSPAKWMAVQSVIGTAIAANSKDDSDKGQSKTAQLKKLQKEIKEAYNAGDTNEEKAKKIITKLTPAEEEQVQGYMDKIKGLLSTEDSSTMSADEIKNKINDIIKNPRIEAQKLGDKMSDLDRNQVVSLVSKNTSLDRMQVENYADKVEKVIRKIQLELSGNNEDSALADLKKQVQSIIDSIGGSNGSDSVVDYSGLSAMLQTKLDDQKENVRTLKARLSNYDRNDVITLITNNTRIDRKDINKVADTVEDSKNQVLEKLQNIEDTAKSKLRMLERKAVIQAEHTRKTAATAAWWLVISAVVSAGAAIAGSLITVF